jgi:hypothetical protein
MEHAPKNRKKQTMLKTTFYIFGWSFCSFATEKKDLYERCSIPSIIFRDQPAVTRDGLRRPSARGGGD